MLVFCVVHSLLLSKVSKKDLIKQYTEWGTAGNLRPWISKKLSDVQGTLKCESNVITSNRSPKVVGFCCWSKRLLGLDLSSEFVPVSRGSWKPYSACWKAEIQALAALTRGNPYKWQVAVDFCLALQFAGARSSVPEHHRRSASQTHVPATFLGKCTNPKPTHPAPLVPHTDPLTRLTTAVAPVPLSCFSRKVTTAALREWWRKALEEPVAVSRSCQQHLPWRQQPDFLLLHQEKSLVGNIPEYLGYFIL